MPNQLYAPSALSSAFGLASNVLSAISVSTSLVDGYDAIFRAGSVPMTPGRIIGKVVAGAQMGALMGNNLAVVIGFAQGRPVVHNREDHELRRLLTSHTVGIATVTLRAISGRELTGMHRPYSRLARASMIAGVAASTVEMAKIITELRWRQRNARYLRAEWAQYATPTPSDLVW